MSKFTEMMMRRAREANEPNPYIKKKRKDKKSKFMSKAAQKRLFYANMKCENCKKETNTKRLLFQNGKNAYYCFNCGTDTYE